MEKVFFPPKAVTVIAKNNQTETIGCLLELDNDSSSRRQNAKENGRI